ncbi:f-box only protein 38 [Trichonephila inaurata madagascariensis]|uniref:F-box only protein 38 n=1 Tax=Trichonephila inaurata madagascariensis TaxID=2747483 RepID=A0A8X6WMZ9_9ARAC|nr:f-box only protein 38 [Trichonephila inaurata madagascariensis]
MTSQKYPNLTDLSQELLCHILQFLPLQEVLSISMLCRKLLAAVSMHLRLRKSIDLSGGKIYGFMPSSITDDHMHTLFEKCPHLESVYGLHPVRVERRRLRKRSTLTIPGIIEALSLCGNLRFIETSDLKVLEAVMQHLPQLRVIGHFQNRDGVFPPHASQRLKLLPYPRVSALHLTGVEVPELTAMPHLEHLHLYCVRFTKLQPFRAFLATRLKTFVMKHCMGPSLSLSCTKGLGMLEADVGHLMIVSSKNLERVFIQPSLTRDSLFVSLSYAECKFPMLKNMHLGYVDKLEFGAEWSNEALLSMGLAEVPDTPSSLTDSGMKVISQLFPNIKSMTVSNCPHLMVMEQWSSRIVGEPQAWRELTDLTLQRCHCLQLPSFALFIAFLPKIEVILLYDMFREPPKGCSHVGLSAGTGLGMSSAVVSNQDEHIAVQGHQQDFELPAEGQGENDDFGREFMEVDHDGNPEHVMILQQEFFEEERRVARPVIVRAEHVDPENGIENIEQEVPENHIRRELNEDYNGEMNQNPEQNNDGDQNASARAETSSSDEEDNQDNIPYHSKRKRSSRKMHCSKRIRSKKSKYNISNDNSEYSKDLHESEESALIDSNNTNETGKCEEDELNCKIRRKKSDEKRCKNSEICKKKCSNGFNPNQPSTSRDGTNEKRCKNSVICNKKCSNGFDPNQPSTSRDGNCFDCNCMGSDSEFKDADCCTNNETKSSKVDCIDSYSEAPSVSTSNDQKILDTDKLDEEKFPGPLTRRRKKVLNQDEKIEPTEHSCSDSVGGKNSKAPNSDDEASLQNGLGTISTSMNNSSYGVFIKQEITDSENECLVDEVAHTKSVINNVKNEEASSSHEGKKDGEKLKKAKKHKKHKHKRSKKAYRKLYHKRGPLTRSKSKYLSDGHNFVSQGTQATSADIRRALRRQRSCSLRCKKQRNDIYSSSHHRSHRHISARQQIRKSKEDKPNVELQNKATSTSDPLMEDDAVQTLRLVSETLISITIISCGISDIVIDHCQSLTHIEIQACRILKVFQLHFSPCLKRLNISQCPKLTLHAVAPEVLSLVAAKKLLVSFEPCMQVYHPSDSEEVIFSKAPVDLGVILFHDYTGHIDETLQAGVQENLLRWMEIVQKLYYSPSFWVTKQNKKRVKAREWRTRYPYGHCLRRFHGMCTLLPSINDEILNWKYQVLTNDYVFASVLENKSWEKGFPAPECVSDYTEDDALLSMIETEYTEKKLRMRRKIISFYIPVIDST